MSNQISNYTDILSIIKRLNNNSLSHFYDNEVFISSIQNYSKDTLYRMALKLLVDYETFYINQLGEYIRNKFKIKSISTENILSLQTNSFINFITSFQSMFNYLKKYIKIDDQNDLQKFNTILNVSTEPIKKLNINSEKLNNLFSEIPYILKNNLERNGFIINTIDIKYSFYEDEYITGVFFYQNKSNDFYNLETKKIKF